jgi:hypothetical protein
MLNFIFKLSESTSKSVSADAVNNLIQVYKVKGCSIAHFTLKLEYMAINTTKNLQGVTTAGLFQNEFFTQIKIKNLRGQEVESFFTSFYDAACLIEPPLVKVSVNLAHMKELFLINPSFASTTIILGSLVQYILSSSIEQRIILDSIVLFLESLEPGLTNEFIALGENLREEMRDAELNYNIDHKQWVKNRFSTINIKGYMINSNDNVVSQPLEVKCIKFSQV